jgi:hypothetical protein
MKMSAYGSVPATMNPKQYLGDGVYADLSNLPQSLTLTTEDGYRATNTIVMEPEVLLALERVIGAWARRGKTSPMSDAGPY